MAAAIVAMGATEAAAQTDLVIHPSGHPDRVASEHAITDVRAFAVARAADRILVAYVQAGEPRARGALRTALLHEGADHRLVREAPDHTLAPLAYALAVSWNGHDGAIVYTVPRPHRGEAPGTHRQRAGSVERSLAEPLGATTLTAGDVMFQRLDENGAPVGRPLLVFEENSRAYGVAIARDGGAWQLAWSGGISVDNEITGTVRTMRIAADGSARAFASDTGFTGGVGNVLRVISSNGSRRDPWVVFSGERCLTHEHDAPLVPRDSEPTSVADAHPRTMLPQQPPHEHIGPPIVCDPRHLYAVSLRADGSTGAIVTGPALSADALALISSDATARMVTAIDQALVVVELDPRGTLRMTRTLAAASTASASPAPEAHDADAIVRAPAILDAAAARDAITVAALDGRRTRVAFTRDSDATHRAASVLLAPAPRTYDVALATDPEREPWLFAMTGTSLGGPLVVLRGDVDALHAAAVDARWQGDERFTQSLLRARAARAAFTAAESGYTSMAGRPDAATNPNLANVAAGLRRLRGPWEMACGGLQERARYLARHGADADITQFAAQQCEMPPEPVAPGAAPSAQ